MTLVPGNMTSGDLTGYPNGSTLNTGALRPNCILVSVENDQGFFTSTFSLELELPVVPSYDEFEILLGSVMYCLLPIIFSSQVFFVFLLFLGMVMKMKQRKNKNYLRLKN